MEDIELKKMLQSYLFFNNMPLMHVAKTIGEPYTTIYMWIKGKRRLSERNIAKIKDYLGGKYTVDAGEIATHLIRSNRSAD